MEQLDVKWIPYDKLRTHRRFIFRNNGVNGCNYDIIDEPITKELCIKLYRGIRCDDKGYKYDHRQYTVSQTAMECMLDTLTSRF